MTMRVRRLVAATATFGLGVTATFVAVGAVTSAEGGDPEPPRPDRLVLEDVGDDTRVAVLDQYDNDVTEEDLGPITVDVDRHCDVTSDLEPLFDVRVTEGASELDLQLIDSRLGGEQKGGGCKGSNARVESGQTLRIDVGETLADLGYAFESGALNIATNQGGGLRYSLDGGPTVATNELVQGQLVIEPSEPFNSVEIEIVDNGSFSLRSDGGPVDTRTEFALVQVGIPIDCNESLSLADFADFGVTVSGTVDDVEFVRFQDKDEECSPAWLQLDVEDEDEVPGQSGVSRDPVVVDPIGDADEIRARVLIQWRVDRLDENGDPKPPADLNDELVRYVQYPDADEAVAVEFCTGAADLSGEDLLNPDGAVGSVDESVDQPWCLLFEDRTLDGDEVVQRMIFSVNGDPKFF